MSDSHGTGRPSEQAGRPEDMGASGENRYLWDRSGAVDGRVRELEDVLSGARADESDVERLGHELAEAMHGPAVTFVSRRVVLRAAAAVAILACVVGAWAGLRARGGGSSTGRELWTVDALAGAPTVEGTAVGESRKLDAGGWVETDGLSRAEVSVRSVGRVTVEPNSRLRLIHAERTEHRMELAEGKLHAFILAPPKLFVVQTPAATAVDMGCIYDLTVEKDGSSLLRVTTGWVELAGSRWSSRVPGGYVCSAKRGKDPGIPRREDASEKLNAAVAALESALESAPESKIAEGLTGAVLAESTRRDAATLWHLVHLGREEISAPAAKRLAELVSTPENAPVESVIGGDARAIERWWDVVRNSY